MLSDEDLENIRKIVRDALTEGKRADKAARVRALTLARVRKLRGNRANGNAPVTQKRVTQEVNGNAAVTRCNAARIGFDFTKGAFDGITEEQELKWQEAFPAVPIPPAIAQAASWLQANPANRKSNYARFLVGWFKRDQDKAGRVR